MKNTILNTVVTVTGLLSVFFIACNKDSDKNATTTRIGCMDSYATNYDALANVAGTCQYEIDALAGAYAVVDSYFYLKQTGPTTYAPDTVVSQDTIVVSVVAHDSLNFSKLINNGSSAPTHFKVNKTDGSFSYYNSTSYVITTSSGLLTNNKLEYTTSTTCTPLTSNNNSRHIHGVRVN